MRQTHTIIILPSRIARKATDKAGSADTLLCPQHQDWFRVEEVQEIVKKISELDGCEIKSLMPEFVVGWSGRA